jgi:hypothetical protein
MVVVDVALIVVVVVVVVAALIVVVVVVVALIVVVVVAVMMSVFGTRLPSFLRQITLSCLSLSVCLNTIQPTALWQWDMATKFLHMRTDAS